MKIALVVPGGVDRSGEYRVIPVLLALIKRLSRHHAVHVFALNQEEQRGEWTLAGAQIHNIGREHTVWRAVRAIWAENRAGAFEVIHAIFSGACGVVAVAAAQTLRVPSLIHIAGGELIALHDIQYGGCLTWRGRLREALVLRAATMVTSASAPSVDSLAAWGIEARRVPLGVDLEVWPPRPPVARRAVAVARLIHVASLNRIKDQHTLLKALACVADSRIVDFRVDIVGEDTLQGEIQRLAAELGLFGRVHFHGFLTTAQLRPLLEAAHLLIHSSRHETGPLVALEAAVAGVPTVGTAVGHIVELAPDAARAVPVGDWAALACAICAVLADEALRIRIATEAFIRAQDEDADYTAATFEALYLEAIQSVTAPARAPCVPRT